MEQYHNYQPNLYKNILLNKRTLKNLSVPQPSRPWVNNILTFKFYLKNPILLLIVYIVVDYTFLAEMST